jgi:hypothetical protein
MKLNSKSNNIISDKLVVGIFKKGWGELYGLTKENPR